MTSFSAVLGVAGAYGDNLNYSLYPESHPGKYNSNSYVHGLLEAVSYSSPGISWSGWVEVLTHPGWGTPVPLAEFGL